MGSKEQQQAHWKWVSTWGETKFNGWLDRWEKELILLTGIESYDNMVTLNVGGGPVPLRFKNAREEILLDNNCDFFENLFPKKYLEGMTVLNQDICSTTIPDKYVDICYVRKTLEYIQNWEGALDQIARIMRPNGLFILMYHERQNDGINLNLLDKEVIIPYMIAHDFIVKKDASDDSKYAYSDANNSMVQLVMRKC